MSNSVKLNIGSGPNKIEGFISVDTIKFNDDVTVLNAGAEVWPWDDESVDEVLASHMIEHLTPQERCHFFNELHRVMKPTGKATVIAPHFASCRAYGDPTHQWPPIGEFFWYYLSKEWREANAPHADKKNLEWGYNCDLSCVWGNGMHPAIVTRNPEYQQYAMTNFKEAIQDLHCTITKK